jgi:hypothetical protein
MGSLSVRETVVPLDIPITKFNSVTPSDGTEFGITALTVNGIAKPITPHQEEFAVAQFTDMSDADKLSAPSYEPFDAGVSLGALPVVNGHDSPRTVTYVERYIDDYQRPSRFGRFVGLSAELHAALLNSAAALGVATRTTGLRGFVTPGMASPINVGRTRYVVAGTEDLALRTDVLAAATTRTGALSAMQSWLAQHPEQRDALQVITEHEAAA